MPNFNMNLTVLSVVGSPFNSALNGLSYYAVGDNDGGTDTGTTDATVAFVGTVGNTLSLNGAPRISVQQLPVGFNLTGTFWTFQAQDGSAYAIVAQRTVSALSTLFAKAIWNWSTLGVPFTSIRSGDSFGPQWVNASYGFFAPINANDLFGFLTVEILVNNSAKFTSYVNKLLQLSGVYQIINNNYNIANPGPYAPGDSVTVTATASLNTVTAIYLNYTNPVTNQGSLIAIPRSAFVSQSPTQLVFVIPPNTPPRANFTVSGVGDGTQFSGTVTMGSLSVLITNGSGVYQIVPGKTSDTIYTNSATGNTTAEVKIPDPFGKTGFIGG